MLPVLFFGLRGTHRASSGAISVPSVAFGKQNAGSSDLLSGCEQTAILSKRIVICLVASLPPSLSSIVTLPEPFVTVLFVIYLKKVVPRPR